MDRLCDNCGAVLHGKFCHDCGQESRKVLRGVGHIIGDFIGDIASWDSRLVRTLVPLMFRPGFLSNEYVRGRRARYVQPVRLYLFASIAFFLLVAIVGQVDSDAVRVGLSDRSVPAAPATESGDDSGLQVGASLAGRPLSERIQLNLPFLDAAGEAEFKRRLDRLAENPELFFRQVLELAPTMMFLMLPVLAFVLKVFYIYKRRFYVEHLVLALHTHSFMFLTFITLVGISFLRTALEGLPLAPVTTGLLTWVVVALVVWIPLYLFLAQKRFYQQGWLLTVIKYLLTGTTYIILLGTFALGLMVASIMTA